MANQNNGAEALNNVVTLNKLFADSFSPINNFVAANTQLRIAEQQRQIARANKLADDEAARQFARETENAKLEADLKREGVRGEFDLKKEGLQQEGLNSRSEAGIQASKDLQATSFSNAQNADLHKEAEAIRSNPDAKAFLPDMDKFANNAIGDQALVHAFYASRTPEKEESVAVGRLIPVTQEIRKLTDEIQKSPLDPTQAKAALYKYLGDPTVNQLLIKEGHYTPDQLQQMAATGDFDAVSKAINTTAANSAWFRALDPKVASQLLSGLLEARAGASANPSSDTMVKAQTLKTLLDTQGQLIPKIRTQAGWDQFHNTLTPPQVTTAAKLPPPPPPSAARTVNPVASPGMLGQAQNDLAQNGLMGVLSAPAGSANAMAAAAGGGYLPQGIPSAADGAAFLRGGQDIQSQVTDDALRRFLTGGLSSPSQFDQPVPFYGPTINPYAQQAPQLTQAPYLPGEPRPF